MLIFGTATLCKLQFEDLSKVDAEKSGVYVGMPPNACVRADSASAAPRAPRPSGRSSCGAWWASTGSAASSRM